MKNAIFILLLLIIINTNASSLRENVQDMLSRPSGFMVVYYPNVPITHIEFSINEDVASFASTQTYRGKPSQNIISPLGLCDLMTNESGAEMYLSSSMRQQLYTYNVYNMRCQLNMEYNGNENSATLCSCSFGTTCSYQSTGNNVENYFCTSYTWTCNIDRCATLASQFPDPWNANNRETIYIDIQANIQLIFDGSIDKTWSVVIDSSETPAQISIQYSDSAETKVTQGPSSLVQASSLYESGIEEVTSTSYLESLSTNMTTMLNTLQDKQSCTTPTCVGVLYQAEYKMSTQSTPDTDFVIMRPCEFQCVTAAPTAAPTFAPTPYPTIAPTSSSPNGSPTSSIRDTLKIMKKKLP